MADTVLNSFNDMSKYRLLVEELMMPLNNKIEGVIGSVKEVSNTLLFNIQRVEEINVFLRHLSLFNKDFEVVWTKLNEIELYRNVNEGRREEDLKEVASKIKTVELIAENNIKTVNMYNNNIKDLAEQFKQVVKDISLYKETLNNKISVFHRVSTSAKQYYDDNVGAVKKEVEKSVAIVKETLSKYSNLSAEIEVTNRQLKGI